MADNLITITLRKKGYGKAPSFILKIFEDEKVSYEGFENVKKLGKYETNTSEDGFIELLEVVKEIDFYSLKEDYRIVKDEKTPATEISITITISEDYAKKKTVKFLQKDPTVPESLKKLENKIIEVSGFNHWNKIEISEKKEAIPIKEEPKKETKEITLEKPSIKKDDKEKITSKSKKIIAAIIFSIVLISAIFIAYQYEFFDFKNTNSSEDQTPPVNNSTDLDNKTLIIDVLDVASEVNGLGDYTKKYTFSIGENFFVYMEYSNFSVGQDENCDLSLELLVRQIGGEKEYEKIAYETNPNKIEHHWEINIDESWPIGTYYVIATLKDNINDKSVVRHQVVSIKA